MVYSMQLHPQPFDAIKSGYKTIEMRLDDERRKGIAKGDLIVFENNHTQQHLTCEVVNVFKYKSFEELYLQHDKTALGYLNDDIALPQDMLKYYQQSAIDQYGVLAIQIRVTNCD